MHLRRLQSEVEELSDDEGHIYSGPSQRALCLVSVQKAGDGHTLEVWSNYSNENNKQRQHKDVSPGGHTSNVPKAN